MKNVFSCIKTIAKIILISLPMSFAACNTTEGESEPFIHSLRFSVKNETDSSLSVKLVVGEVPSPNARFEELKLIPDEIYKLSGNDLWSAELGTMQIINPGKHNYVFNLVPFSDLRYMQPDKIITFILTISRGSETLYRVVGWDVSEGDMQAYGIDDKMWGYYHTAEENYIDCCGQSRMFPLFTSKLLADGKSFVSSPAYYIRATPAGVHLQEMDPSAYISDNTYWKYN
jgi:hypothetical protein